MKFRNDDADDDGLTRDRRERGSRFERGAGPTRYYERAEANGGPDAKSVLRYPDGLLAIELLDVSRMRSLYVPVPHVNARTTNVLRTPILSRPSPNESVDGLIPSAEDSTTIGPSERTSPGRKDRTK